MGGSETTSGEILKTGTLASHTSSSASVVHPSQSYIDNWVEKPLNTLELKDFHRRLIEMVACLGIPFAHVDENVFHEMLYSLRTAMSKQKGSIPTRQTLGGTILNTRSEESVANVNTVLQKAVASGRKLGAVIDGYEMINKYHITGVVVTYGGSTAPYDALPGRDTHNGIEIAK